MYSIKVTKDTIKTASKEDLLISADALEYFLDIMDARGDYGKTYYDYCELLGAVRAALCYRMNSWQGGGV